MKLKNTKTGFVFDVEREHAAELMEAFGDEIKPYKLTKAQAEKFAVFIKSKKVTSDEEKILGC